MKSDMRSNGIRKEGDIVSIVIQSVLSQRNHSSIYVRETVAIAALIIMTQNYSCLFGEEIKVLKNLFVDGLHDTKPEGERILDLNSLFSNF